MSGGSSMRVFLVVDRTLFPPHETKRQEDAPIVIAVVVGQTWASVLIDVRARFSNLRADAQYVEPPPDEGGFDAMLASADVLARSFLVPGYMILDAPSIGIATFFGAELLPQAVADAAKAAAKPNDSKKVKVASRSKKTKRDYESRKAV